jgi:flagellar motor switch protein FliM
MDKLSNQTWAAYKSSRRDDKMRQRVIGQLDQAQVTLAAVLASTTIKLGELRHLQVGDLILTEKPASAPLLLRIEGRDKYIGQLGQYKGNRAFKVTRAYQHKDRV